MSNDVGGQRPFSAFLQDQRGGGLHGELSDALAELAGAVSEHDKPGTLTLTINVKPNGPGAVIVTDEIKTKQPRPDRGASLFFTDDHGNLSRRNPRQPELPLREVPDNSSDTPRELDSSA